MGNHVTYEHVFDQNESNVRSYCRHFPVVFSSAKGAWLTTTSGQRFLDLLAGAGTLNYGHNNPLIVEPVLDYIRNDGIVHSLDLHTEAKAEFISLFREIVLRPRSLDYKMQFPGPTGTNAVEAALKLARKVTGRTNVVAFTNGFHGVSLGSLAATTNEALRGAAGAPLGNVTFFPYDGYLGEEDTTTYIEHMLTRRGTGIAPPAAILLEVVQGEGGLAAAGSIWLSKIQVICRHIGALLIVDDIQAGCGRTGRFFSFEDFGITPDIIVLSKSLSGFGTPLSLVLIRPDLDLWEPGEHSGTFRGNNLGFVGASAALRNYWVNSQFEKSTKIRSEMVYSGLSGIVEVLPLGSACIKGRGLLTGLEFTSGDIAASISRNLFQAGLMAETCGANGNVLKLLPTLTIELDDLKFALKTIRKVVLERLHSREALAV